MVVYAIMLLAHFAQNLLDKYLAHARKTNVVCTVN